MRVLCAVLLFSLAGCFDEEIGSKRMIWDCPDDAHTQDVMVSYAIQCFAVQTKDWKRKHIANEKLLSQEIQEKCLDQATWFFCKREEAP